MNTTLFQQQRPTLILMSLLLQQSIVCVFVDDENFLTYLVDDFRPATNLTMYHELVGQEITPLLKDYTGGVSIGSGLDVVKLRTALEQVGKERLSFSTVGFRFAWIRPR